MLDLIENSRINILFLIYNNIMFLNFLFFSFYLKNIIKIYIFMEGKRKNQTYFITHTLFFFIYYIMHFRVAREMSSEGWNNSLNDIRHFFND